MTPEEYPVHETKREFEALLLREAERLGLPAGRAQGAPGVSGASLLDARRTGAGRRAQSAVRLDAVAQPGASGPARLADAAQTRGRHGVPLVSWQLALHQVSTEQLAEVLGQAAPADTLTVAERHLVELARACGPALTALVMALLEQYHQLQQGGPQHGPQAAR